MECLEGRGASDVPPPFTDEYGFAFRRAPDPVGWALAWVWCRRIWTYPVPPAQDMRDVRGSVIDRGD